MARIPVQVGPIIFTSKTSAEDYFRQILYRHEIGVRIPEPDATEIGWLLERHPEYGDKLGNGPEFFSVRNAIFGTRCFEIVRKDGTATDFSFGSCVDGKPPTPMSEAMRALRAEVTEDILERKRIWFEEEGNSEGKVPCAITQVLVGIDEAHADHAPPRTFGTLAIAFLEARGIDASSGFVTPPSDNQYLPKMVDRALAEEWRAYHHKLAVIRVVAKDANLKCAHEGKVKKGDKQLRMGE